MHVNANLENNVIVSSYSDTKNISEQTSLLVMHEFGHALGLGHYVVEDVNDLRKIVAGEISSPSIMVEVSNESAEDQITSIDVEKILSVYGKDGFGNKNKIPK